MRFANLHDDIGNDIYDHKDQKDRLDTFHYSSFQTRKHVF